MSTENGESPTEPFYRMREAAQSVGVQPYVLRYWETEFPELSPERGANGNRRFCQKDIDVARAIKKLLHVDRHGIDEARKRLPAELRR